MMLHQSEQSEVLEWFRSTTAVGNARNKGPDLIAVTHQTRSSHGKCR